MGMVYYCDLCGKKTDFTEIDKVYLGVNDYASGVPIIVCNNCRRSIQYQTKCNFTDPDTLKLALMALLEKIPDNIKVLPDGAFLNTG